MGFKEASKCCTIHCEVEHVFASLATSQAIWLRIILEDVGKKQGEATQIMCDSKSSIAMAKNQVFSNRSKHIALKHHFIREAVEENVIEV
ncbi:unnamed protein product [Prunus brigantina]